MTEAYERNNLELSVTNFGPIARAEIDLRPMTVFVGPSNTGKSYLAILIYALHKFFGGQMRHLGFLMPETRTIFGLGSGLYDARPSSEEIDSLVSGIGEMMSMIEAERTLESSHSILPESVASPVRRGLGGVRDFADTLNEEISRCFGVEDTSILTRERVEDGATITVERSVSDTRARSGHFVNAFAIRGKDRDLSASIPTDIPLRFVVSEHLARVSLALSQLRTAPKDDEDARQYLAYLLIREIVDKVGSHIVSPLSRSAHYLPADRTGVMHAHRVVVGSLIGQASRAGFQDDTPLPRLSGVLADFLEQLIGLGDIRDGTREKEVARQIEEKILQGEVRMGKSLVGYPEFFYRPATWKENLRLMNTSSMVSELAPVVLYLRHVVQPGEVLIIEEPESHMHPSMQVEFTRQLAAAVRAGVRVMVTTHSEWVLDELANLVRLSKLPESRRQGIAGADFALSPDELGVWLFEPKKRGRGSVVEELPMSEEYGGFRSGFDDTAMETHNNYAEISSRLEETAVE